MSATQYSNTPSFLLKLVELLFTRQRTKRSYNQDKGCKGAMVTEEMTDFKRAIYPKDIGIQTFRGLLGTIQKQSIHIFDKATSLKEMNHWVTDDDDLGQRIAEEIQLDTNQSVRDWFDEQYWGQRKVFWDSMQMTTKSVEREFAGDHTKERERSLVVELFRILIDLEADQRRPARSSDDKLPLQKKAEVRDQQRRAEQAREAQDNAVLKRNPGSRTLMGISPGQVSSHLHEAVNVSLLDSDSEEGNFVGSDVGLDGVFGAGGRHGGVNNMNGGGGGGGTSSGSGGSGSGVVGVAVGGGRKRGRQTSIAESDPSEPVNVNTMEYSILTMMKEVTENLQSRRGPGAGHVPVRVQVAEEERKRLRAAARLDWAASVWDLINTVERFKTPEQHQTLMEELHNKGIVRSKDMLFFAERLSNRIKGVLKEEMVEMFTDLLSEKPEA